MKQIEEALKKNCFKYWLLVLEIKKELSVQNGIHKSQSRCIHDKRDNDDDANDDVLD